VPQPEKPASSMEGARKRRRIAYRTNSAQSNEPSGVRGGRNSSQFVQNPKEIQETTTENGNGSSNHSDENVDGKMTEMQDIKIEEDSEMDVEFVEAEDTSRTLRDSVGRSRTGKDDPTKDGLSAFAIGRSITRTEGDVLDSSVRRPADNTDASNAGESRREKRSKEVIPSLQPKINNMLELESGRNMHVKGLIAQTTRWPINTSRRTKLLTKSRPNLPFGKLASFPPSLLWSNARSFVKHGIILLNSRLGIIGGDTNIVCRWHSSI
jgi:hypothetical protein